MGEEENTDAGDDWDGTDAGDDRAGTVHALVSGDLFPDWTKPSFWISEDDMPAAELAAMRSAMEGTSTVSEAEIDDIANSMEEALRRRVPCLRCHYAGFLTCATILVDDCRTYLFGISSAVDSFERLIKIKVKEGKIPLYDGEYLDVRDIHNDVALFVCRVRDVRNLLYARCAHAFDRQNWAGFVGEMPSSDTFRENRRVPFEERMWQHNSPHKHQFYAVGEALKSWDEKLTAIMDFLEVRRPDNMFHLRWKGLKATVKAARNATRPPCVQPYVDKLEASVYLEHNDEEHNDEEHNDEGNNDEE